MDKPPRRQRPQSRSIEPHMEPGYNSRPRKAPANTTSPSSAHIGICPLSRPSPSRILPAFVTPPRSRTVPLSRFAPTTPHIVAWQKVADSVVGRHPDAKPLITRPATLSEIALISGHISIPWAYMKEKKTQPTPVKVRKPIAARAPSPDRSGLLLNNIRNVRTQDIFGARNNNAKRPAKPGRSFRHGRGKENIPVPPAPAISGRRI
ncbi:hypothetical protein B0H34DRAFT_862111 [Crassisporium funariophilum]|nr:hypothetical protein B0H34DRAFT_862111 [Crassisporium funariophilum]